MTDYHNRREKYEHQDPTMYYARDFGLIASLVIYGQDIVSYDVSEPKRVQVVFKKTKELLDLSKRYWEGDLPVYSLEFWNTIRSVKQSAFSQNIN